MPRPVKEVTVHFSVSFTPSLYMDFRLCQSYTRSQVVSYTTKAVIFASCSWRQGRLVSDSTEYRIYLPGRR